MAREFVTNEELVRAWQSGTCIKGILQSLGGRIKASNLLSRAYFLRKKGVPLKRLREGTRNDYRALAELAESLNGTH